MERRSNTPEGFTPALAEDGVALKYRPDLGADVFVHPQTHLVYLDLGDGRYERTQRHAPDLARAGRPAHPAAEFPTERPRGMTQHGVDLSVEGYA